MDTGRFLTFAVTSRVAQTADHDLTVAQTVGGVRVGQAALPEEVHWFHHLKRPRADPFKTRTWSGATTSTASVDRCRVPQDLVLRTRLAWPPSGTQPRLPPTPRRPVSTAGEIKTDLVDPRSSGFRFHVHHVDPGGNERRQNQSVSLLGGVTEAATAGVPAGVVQLVPEVGHRQPVDHLARQSTKADRRSERLDPEVSWG